MCIYVYSIHTLCLKRSRIPWNRMGTSMQISGYYNWPSWRSLKDHWYAEKIHLFSTCVVSKLLRKRETLFPQVENEVNDYRSSWRSRGELWGELRRAGGGGVGESTHSIYVGNCIKCQWETSTTGPRWSWSPSLWQEGMTRL